MAEVVFFFSRPVASELLSLPRHGVFEQLLVTDRERFETLCASLQFLLLAYCHSQFLAEQKSRVRNQDLIEKESEKYIKTPV